jgi:hypothetical protein
MRQLGGADTHETVGLQHPQQLHLQRRRHLRDLVEKQRAAVGAFEESKVLAVGACEAAAFVAEDLAFDQLRREGPAVHRDERSVAARAVRVQALGGELLAGAAFRVMNTGRPVGATRTICVATCAMAGDCPSRRGTGCGRPGGWRPLGPAAGTVPATPAAGCFPRA